MSVVELEKLDPLCDFVSSERSAADGGSGSCKYFERPGNLATADGTTSERRHNRLPGTVRLGVGATDGL